MLANPNKVKNQALKLTKNLQTAEDIIQDLTVYFLERPELEVSYPGSYVWRGLYSRFINGAKFYDDHMIFDKVDKKTGKVYSHFDKMQSPDDIHNANIRLEFSSIFDLIEDVCSEKEVEAILEVLEKDSLSNNAVSETTRANRRFGIIRMQKYLFNRVLGIPNHVNSDRSFYLRKNEERKKRENSTNS